jgi:hypothetical protein
MSKVSISQLRKEALELQQAVADDDVIRMASLWDRLKTKYNRWMDPELDRDLTEVEDDAKEMKDLHRELGKSVRQFDTARKNTDFETMQEVSAEVPRIVSEIGQKSQQANRSAQRAEARLGGYYSAEDMEREGFREEMMGVMPQEMDIPVGQWINVPIWQSSWLANRYDVVDIDITDRARARLLEKVAMLLKTRSKVLGVTPEDVDQIMQVNGQEFIWNLMRAALTQSMIRRYDFAQASGRIKQRSIGQMRLILNVGAVRLPGLKPEEEIWINFPEVWFTDSSPMDDTTPLSFMRAQKISIAQWRTVQRSQQRMEQYRAQSPEAEEEPPQDLGEEDVGMVVAKRIDKLQKLSGESMKKEGPLRKIVRRATLAQKLPLTKTLITLDKDVPFEFRVRYARILSTALRNELEAECSVHHDGDNIEVEADLYGTEKPVLKAVAAISNGVSNAFKDAAGVGIKTHVYPGIKSKYALIESDVTETAFRKFALRVW